MLAHRRSAKFRDHFDFFGVKSLDALRLRRNVASRYIFHLRLALNHRDRELWILVRR